MALWRGMTRNCKHIPYGGATTSGTPKPAHTHPSLMTGSRTALGDAMRAGPRQQAQENSMSRGR